MISASGMYGVGYVANEDKLNETIDSHTDSVASCTVEQQGSVDL